MNDIILWVTLHLLMYLNKLNKTIGILFSAVTSYHIFFISQTNLSTTTFMVQEM